MDKPGIYNALNRLLTVLERSLPMYLSYTSPWTHGGDQRARQALANIVDARSKLANRVAKLVLESGPIELGAYPFEFYDMHDLSLDFLLSKLVEYQKRDIAKHEQCARDLQVDRRAGELADEALGAARGHLETLEELAGELNKSSPTWMVP